MAIGELLLAKGIINEAQLNKVLHQQKIAGGRIGDNLVALGYLSREELEAIDEYLAIEVIRFGPRLTVEKAIAAA